jgi:hypothetical protein
MIRLLNNINKWLDRHGVIKLLFLIVAVIVPLLILTNSSHALYGLIAMAWLFFIALVRLAYHNKLLEID